MTIFHSIKQIAVRACPDKSYGRLVFQPYQKPIGVYVAFPISVPVAFHFMRAASIGQCFAIQQHVENFVKL
jgi:hypothetical protein